MTNISIDATGQEVTCARKNAGFFASLRMTQNDPLRITQDERDPATRSLHKHQQQHEQHHNAAGSSRGRQSLLNEQLPQRQTSA